MNRNSQWQKAYFAQSSRGGLAAELKNLIASLEPKDALLPQTHPRRYAYEVLHQTVVLGRSATDTAARFYISRSQLYRIREKAIADLCQLWQEREVQSSEFQVPSSEEVSSSEFRVSSSEEVSSFNIHSQGIPTGLVSDAKTQKSEVIDPKPETRDQKPKPKTKNLKM